MNKHLHEVSYPLHIIFFLSLFFVEYTWMNAVGIIILWTLIGGYGVAVGYHRYYSHKSFETYPIIAKLLAYLGLMSADGSLPFWVALHRGVHHRWADKPQDLHSPIHGKWSAFIAWQRSIEPSKVSLLSARDIMKDPYLVFLHENHNKIFWGTIGICAIISWQFALGMLIPAILLSHHQDNLVNVVGHIPSMGYRNHNTDDNSVNNWFTGLFVWGQGWHNNHHHNAGSADFGNKWWEFDSSAKILIPLIRKR